MHTLSRVLILKMPTLWHIDLGQQLYHVIDIHKLLYKRITTATQRGDAAVLGNGDYLGCRFINFLL